jgi:RNA polymerase sigma factor (sigma-70 family)
MADQEMNQPAGGLDAAAFSALYDGRAEDVLRFFARRTLDAQLAADLTAETFAIAVASRGSFDPARGDVGAWLFGIARHQLARYVRTRKVERAARRRVGFPERSLSGADLERVEALIDFADVGRRVKVALGGLKRDQREAVVLRVIDGLGYADVADRLGCSEQAARARVSRGLRELGLRLATTPSLEHGDVQ